MKLFIFLSVAVFLLRHAYMGKGARERRLNNVFGQKVY